MNDIINYFVKSIESSTQSLKKKSILVEKPWGMIDEEGAIQKLIFKRDNGLILSKNGKVTEGSWEYFPEARALLINRGHDKLLLKEQFIDENVLILKKDGTDKDFFALANENSLPEYNVLEYLNSIKCKNFSILEIPLKTGETLQLHDGLSGNDVSFYKDHRVEKRDNHFQNGIISDGSYVSKRGEMTFYIKNNIVELATKNLVRNLLDGRTFEIENATFYVSDNTNRKLTIEGDVVGNLTLKDTENIIYKIEESIIKKILIHNTYKLKDGQNIVIEQSRFEGISKGDKIISTENPSLLPDGSYRIKGRLFKIRIFNNQIV